MALPPGLLLGLSWSGWVWQQLAKGREPNLAEPGQSWLTGDAQAGVRARGPLAVVLRRKQRLSAGGRRVSLGSRTREGLGSRARGTWCPYQMS